MPALPYDATRNALFHAGRADNFFQLGPLPNDAALCVEMARLAYVKEETRLAPYLARAQFDKVQAFGYASVGTQAFIAAKRGDGLTVVAFRGSEPEDPSDIFADADFKLTDWRDAAGQSMGKVHEGFACVARDDNIFQRIKTYLDTLPGTERILITGHSLGAALATLMASWVPHARMYTFGSPRVGNDAFAAALQGRTATRYVNCADLVTRVPPPEVLGYTHVGKLAYLDRHGRLLDSPGEALMLEDALQAHAAFLPYALMHGTVYSRELADHAPINYVSGVMGLRA